MKRKELEPMKDLVMDMGNDIQGQRHYQPWAAYDKDEADSVMDAMEARIKSLEADLKESNSVQLEHLTSANELISSLEEENKSLRFNLEDWKHKAEEMELASKSFDAEIKRSHERIQKLTNENADFVMEVEKLQERIKELEDKVQMKDFFWEGCGLSKRGFKNTIEVANYIEDLESRQPKWISVEERMPTASQLVAFYKKGNFIKTTCIYHDAYVKCGYTHWMPLPEPPTTEESSSVEKEG